MKIKTKNLKVGDVFKSCTTKRIPIDGKEVERTFDTYNEIMEVADSPVFGPIDFSERYLIFYGQYIPNRGDGLPKGGTHMGYMAMESGDDEVEVVYRRPDFEYTPFANLFKDAEK